MPELRKDYVKLGEECVKLSIEQQYGNIYLVTKTGANTAEMIREVLPGKKICVCDFKLDDAKAGTELPSGAIDFEGLLIVDHHLPLPRMIGQVTSTEIACRHVGVTGGLDPACIVVINHIDTDSLLAALVLTGALEPDPVYIEAARAADHTGEENVISDMLQSLEECRKLFLSAGVLMEVVRERIEARNTLKKLIAAKGLRELGRIRWAILDKPVDAALALELIPEDGVILLAAPMKGGSGKWKIRIRLGTGVRDINLLDLDLPNFGGRWNAGSTSRNGGTEIHPEEYVRRLDEQLRKAAGGN